jgi:hypothetical protein
MNDDSIIMNVTVSSRLHTDTPLGLLRAWRLIPYNIRREYNGPYYLVDRYLFDPNTAIISIKLTKLKEKEKDE